MEDYNGPKRRADRQEFAKDREELIRLSNTMLNYINQSTIDRKELLTNVQNLALKIERIEQSQVHMLDIFNIAQKRSEQAQDKLTEHLTNNHLHDCQMQNEKFTNESESLREELVQLDERVTAIENGISQEKASKKGEIAGINKMKAMYATFGGAAATAVTMFWDTFVQIISSIK